MQATALRRLELDLLDNNSTMSASHRLPACKPSRAAHATKALPGERCSCMRAQQGRPSPARDRALRLCLRPRSDRCSERYAYASQNDQRLGSLELCFGSTGAVSNRSRPSIGTGTHGKGRTYRRLLHAVNPRVRDDAARRRQSRILQQRTRSIKRMQCFSRGGTTEQ